MTTAERQTTETRGFETEVKQLLQLMIHSLYSNKEIFLRELISNASDAADKLRFETLKHPEYYEQDSELKIWIEHDETANTLTIRDNGIGMSFEEVVKNLGTIARSGTKEFLGSLSGDAAKDSNLIGQFGVGFYSSFMVADSVTVKTRKAGLPPSEGVLWTSKGEGDYTIEGITQPARGTEIVLHLKADETEFASGMRLRHIIKQYSNHISFPIYMKQEDNTTEEEVVNRATALWTLPKADISAEQYQEFYKQLTHDYQDALDWSHNRVEGKLEYISLLYVPARAPFDLWDPNNTKGLKLYVRRVFIMEDAEQLLPRYLRFVRGLLDSNDLPLNVSREILQSSRIVDTIRQGLVKRVLSMLESMAQENPEKYSEFWKNFGTVLKEGPAEDIENRERIAKLLRFASTQGGDIHSKPSGFRVGAEPRANEVYDSVHEACDDGEGNTAEKLRVQSMAQSVSLEAYIARMKPDQDKIYYSAADSYIAAKNSPHLEIFKKKGIEVLLLSDKVDEWLVSHLTEFEGKSFQSVARGTFEDSEFTPETDETFKTVLEKIQTVLGERVKSVRLTKRLTDSPACVVADEQDLSAHMERILRAAGQSVNTKPVLELNPEHPLIQTLEKETDSVRFEDLSHLLLDQAILAEGGQLEDPAAFVKRVNSRLMESLS